MSPARMHVLTRARATSFTPPRVARDRSHDDARAFPRARAHATKSRHHTRATRARDRGIDPLARASRAGPPPGRPGHTSARFAPCTLDANSHREWLFVSSITDAAEYERTVVFV